MQHNGFLNTALLTGFAWQAQDGAWLLRQREPEALGLPLVFAEGVRAPENREAIDVAGSLVTDGGAPKLEVRFLERAAKTSFPPDLKWTVGGVAPGTPLFEGQMVTRYWKDEVPGEPNVNQAILDTLQPTQHWPQDVLDVLARDPEMAAWAKGAVLKRRLVNFVALTGMVGKVAQRFTHNDKLYFTADLHMGPAPLAPIRIRLTQDLPGFREARKRLLSFAPFPVTVIGTFLAKVRPNDDGSVRTIEYYVRASNVLPALAEDSQGPMDWVMPWREAARPHTQAAIRNAGAVPA